MLPKTSSDHEFITPPRYSANDVDVWLINDYVTTTYICVVIILVESSKGTKLQTQPSIQNNGLRARGWNDGKLRVRGGRGGQETA